jgi:hypothetical protein
MSDAIGFSGAKFRDAERQPHRIRDYRMVDSREHSGCRDPGPGTSGGAMLEPGTRISLGGGRDYVVDTEGMVYAEVSVSYRAFLALDPKVIENMVVQSMVRSDERLRNAKILPIGVDCERVVFSIEGNAARMVNGNGCPGTAHDAYQELRRRGMAVDLACLLIDGDDHDTFEGWLSHGVTGNDELSRMTYAPMRVEGDTIVFGVRGDPRYAMASLGLIEHPEETSRGTPSVR